MLRRILIIFFTVIFCGLLFGFDYVEYYESESFIKWVDCNVSDEVLKKVYKLSQKYYASEIEFDFVEAIAYLATKNGNNFSYKKDSKNLNELVKKLENKDFSISKYYENNTYYAYNYASYQAIFAEFVGEYIVGNQIKFGLKNYFPLAKGYWYSHYDDFGNSRSFGYKRKHLGHDIMGSVGTPIMAIEGGIVTELGWNRFGGWRIGIRSFDQKRYYYYAHLRKNKPFAENIKIGDTVMAGQHIGYLGNTGYSTTENTNMQSGKPHLHIGMQIIFDKSQEDGNGEIWIDLYAISSFLASNRKTI